MKSELHKIHNEWKYPKARDKWLKHEEEVDEERMRQEQHRREYAANLEIRMAALMEEARKKYL